MKGSYTEQLKKLLTADEDKRNQLLAEGRLYSARYEEDMKEVHERNAEKLNELIEQYGWPHPVTHGEDACRAAFLIAQHAITKPDFQDKCLHHIKACIAEGYGDPTEAAYLEDRLLMAKGKPQVYGTQHILDPDSNELVPYQIENPKAVNERRAQIGLGPLEEKTKQLNEERRASKALDKHQT